MGEYVDLRREAEEALEVRRYRRRRIVGGIRGRLRLKHKPRSVAAILFSVAFIPGGGVLISACLAGSSAWGTLLALAIILQWPVFVWLIGRYSLYLAERDDFLQHLEESIAHDLDAEARESSGIFSCEDNRLREAINGGIRGGIQSGGGGGLPILLLVGLLTLGAWIVWQLLRSIPTLLAETILDRPLAARRPNLAEHVVIEPWRQNAFAGTALYFVGLALVVLVLGPLVFLLRSIKF